MAKHTVVSLKQTCTACPSQWEGKMADGQEMYVRFRWGTLQVSIADTVDNAVGAAYSPYDEEDAARRIAKAVNPVELKERLDSIKAEQEKWSKEHGGAICLIYDEDAGEDPMDGFLSEEELFFHLKAHGIDVQLS